MKATIIILPLFVINLKSYCSIFFSLVAKDEKKREAIKKKNRTTTAIFFSFIFLEILSKTHIFLLNYFLIHLRKFIKTFFVSTQTMFY